MSDPEIPQDLARRLWEFHGKACHFVPDKCDMCSEILALGASATGEATQPPDPAEEAASKWYTCKSCDLGSDYGGPDAPTLHLAAHFRQAYSGHVLTPEMREAVQWLSEPDHVHDCAPCRLARATVRKLFKLDNPQPGEDT